jgi:hypothetical protein
MESQTRDCQWQSHVQDYFHIADLPQEYWQPKTLSEIGSAIGTRTPLSLDDATKNRFLTIMQGFLLMWIYKDF